MEIGELLGAGRSADVHAIGDSREAAPAVDCGLSALIRGLRG